MSYTVKLTQTYMVTKILLCGLVYLCLNDTYFSRGPRANNIPLLCTLHIFLKDRVSPSGSPNMST